MALLESCPVCKARVGRNRFSDYWRCDNGHTIYRGPEPKATRYELRQWSAEPSKYNVWDLLADEPFYDSVADEYAYGLDESQARSLLSRLLATDQSARR